MNRQKISKLLIANRGEIAIRIARACAELGIETVSVFSEDDHSALHVRATDRAVALPGTGASAYLNADQIIARAVEYGCSAIHPGYGFLSENAHFARCCMEASIAFVGPGADVLELFGDKAQARVFAQSCGVRIPRGTDHAVTAEEASDFLQRLGPGAAVMIKAVAGGGGRGMRLVRSPGELQDAYARCVSEARLAFGNGAVYVESYVSEARHIEIQIVGDGVDVVHFGERDCSIQRRHQKLIEIAPSPTLDPAMRETLTQAAVKMAKKVRYLGLGTFEFLVSGVGAEGTAYVFIEANPRLQVEHTVTEEVMGVDLVQLQLQIAQGAQLSDLGLTQERIGPPRGFAIQSRVNMDAGFVEVQGSGNQLEIFDLPGGPGVRIDTLGYAGYEPSPHFDSLLAKVIVRHPSPQFLHVADRAYRALCEMRVVGVAHNLPLLQNILRHPEFRSGAATTEFIARHPVDTGTEPSSHRQFFVEHRSVLPAQQGTEAAPDADAVTSPMRAKILEISVTQGQAVSAGQQLAVVEAMKMEHVIAAEWAGVVRSITVQVGDLVQPGGTIAYVEPRDAGEVAEAVDATEIATDEIRKDLAESMELHRLVLDEARPDAVAKRRAVGRRTARENIADLCDTDSFVEYGALAVAAMRTTRGDKELRRVSPADGFIFGMAAVNGVTFPPDRSRCLVASYDYTVFAGTQGLYGHMKHDRMFQLAENARLPVILFTEGGGGRPAESDKFAANMANPTFWHFGRLSGTVPLIGIAAGRCFAGNAALLGMCDVLIATRDASIGMGGPAMIEGAGLGVVKPEDVGPSTMHARAGVVDILVDDEAQAVVKAKAYLSYFQGPTSNWQSADQQPLRNVIPERRTRAYDIRRVIELLADAGSVTELRAHFGRGAVTALARIEGRPVGIIANNPLEQAGAIGAEEADKFDRFLKLCNTFGVAVISLCDTPGIMVGPDAEKTGLVRRSSAIFLTGAQLKVPYFTVILRKAYGLGAHAMAGGSFHRSSFFTIAWPTAEFGGMGLEGQIKLGFRAELEAIADPKTRQARFQELVDQLYERGKAVKMAPFLSIDDVIDPADTRRWIVKGLTSWPASTAPSHH